MRWRTPTARPVLCVVVFLVSCSDRPANIPATDSGGDVTVSDGAMPDSAMPDDARDVADVNAADSITPRDASTTSRVYGVTVDDVFSDLPGIVDSLRALPHRPTTRIVFDEGRPASQYDAAVTAIHAVSDVMGEILDSEYVAQTSVAAYRARTSEYLAAFGSRVDIWEVGNEINGEWVDTSPGGVADVVAKMSGAFDLVRAAGGRTALTLYGCSDSVDSSHDMLTWAAANVPARMRDGLDQVLVSFYEGDCGVAPPDWPTVFHRLRAIFPTASLGFGETGAVTSSGARITDASVAGPYLQRYYGMAIDEPGYIGGHFWWYFAEEMVPRTSPMFTVLSDAIR